MLTTQACARDRTPRTVAKLASCYSRNLLEPGSRQLPLRHLSARVPWHDAGWSGSICEQPTGNVACVALSRIRELKDDAREDRIAGRSWAELDPAQLPPCVAERAGFMAEFEFSRTVTHPYVRTSPAHERFADTELRIPPYSLAPIPFRWMLAENAEPLAAEYELGFRPELEVRAQELMGFKTSWVQDRHNQLVFLDTFFSAVEPQRSLCFLYAKRTPLTDDPRRVLIGAGLVTGRLDPIEYQYAGPSDLRSVLWERVIRHSIRPGFADGFLLPYRELVALAAEDPDIDIERHVAFAPEDAWQDFAYAAEHVSNDAAIASLLACLGAVKASENLVSGAWGRVTRWIDQQLNALWRLRGPCPGLGSALMAFGLDHGNLIAFEIATKLGENEDPWPLVDNAFADPTALGEAGRWIDRTTAQKWQSLDRERKALLRLISRLDVTGEQAIRYYQPTERRKARIDVRDDELLANPYLLYELDRPALNPVAIATVDRGAFPNEVIQRTHPLPVPSALDGPVDPRRVRALTVWTLEQLASAGDTLADSDRVIQSIRETALDPPCRVDADLMRLVEGGFDGVVARASMADGTPAYQLDRLAGMGALIRRQVDLRIGGARLDLEGDWQAALAAKLPPIADEDSLEVRAREEKTAALGELAASRISVLIGPAGTGKTTLLSVLCEHPQVAAGGIRLLAPTGKARVMMDRAMHRGARKAQTVAQFLLPIDRYDAETGRYRRSDQARVQDARTVIIDEASMLTEDQLGAVLDGLAGVERLVLVGDPRQLPPIGSGRPFVDIIARLAPPDSEHRFPRVGPGYAELTVRRRGQGKSGDDLLLADWFSGQATDPAADEVWDRLASGVSSDRLWTKRWDKDTELEALLGEALVQELGLHDLEDELGFEQSIGGSKYGESVYFWPSKSDRPGAGASADRWQLLSPVRGQPHGVAALNRLIQTRFRTRTVRWAQEPGRVRRIPKPAGPEGIVYGDKVISVRNQRRKHVWPDVDSQHYVANGEIGIVVGEFRGKQGKFTPRALEVEFASQLGAAYKFFAGEMGGDDGEPPLELAYAITVHKSQGSEFGLTILVLPNPCRLLSRELLYTALTRQRERLVILHQGDFHDFVGYAASGLSETARRTTNLFRAPAPVEVEGTFLEEGLINRTRRGELVRSKSEVIIANLLHDRGLDYRYEQPLRGLDGSTKYPDFTIDQVETGLRVFWEHLGLLTDPGYSARWERKLDWYRAQGVVPFEEGGGGGGILVTSRDDERGGIDSQALATLVDRVLPA